MRIKIMECPGCGAEIEVLPDSRFGVCAYCGRKVMIETNTYEYVIRDEARILELRQQEEARRRIESQQQQDKQKEMAADALSILTSDEAGAALKSVGKLALRFLKKGL